MQYHIKHENVTNKLLSSLSVSMPFGISGLRSCLSAQMSGVEHTLAGIKDACQTDMGTMCLLCLLHWIGFHLEDKISGFYLCTHYIVNPLPSN